MNAYLTSVIENVKKKAQQRAGIRPDGGGGAHSLEPVIEKHPEYEKVDLLNRMVEPSGCSPSG